MLYCCRTARLTHQRDQRALPHAMGHLRPFAGGGPRSLARTELRSTPPFLQQAIDKGYEEESSPPDHPNPCGALTDRLRPPRTAVPRPYGQKPGDRPGEA